MPVLEYCFAVWRSAAGTCLKLLDRVVSGEKCKVFYGKEPPSGESILPQNVGSVINYLQSFNDLVKWETPATDNGVRDGRPN